MLAYVLRLNIIDMRKDLEDYYLTCFTIFMPLLIIVNKCTTTKILYFLMSISLTKNIGDRLNFWVFNLNSKSSYVHLSYVHTHKNKIIYYAKYYHCTKVIILYEKL